MTVLTAEEVDGPYQQILQMVKGSTMLKAGRMVCYLISYYFLSLTRLLTLFWECRHLEYRAI